ncbi:MAG: hypothetical protein JWM11_4109, partial [Planctomycetaceae bacterium]|nr:hypothetical protein [Planctomycetaceae bacterium]
RIDFAAAEFVWAVLGGLILTFLMRRPVHSMHRLLRSFSTRPLIPALALSATLLSIQLAVASYYGWPVPALHDEFSYLLAADTFAAGRATNPTHPAWEFLETYHVIWHPTYQSKYPPGNGLVLAAGQVLTGRPIVGIWICLAVSTGLVFWMLHGWFSTVWSVVGATILICNWPITKLWGQTYYGGVPALMGGLLLFGAAARLLRGPCFLNTVWLCCGLMLLAVTRPYEGLVASLPIVGLIACTAWTSRTRNNREWVLWVCLPFGLIMGAGFMTLAWYHWQVTGSPWVWPYRLYEATYTRRTHPLNTVLALTELGPRERTIPSLEYESSAAMLRIAETKPGWYAFWKIVRQWWFHVGLLSTLPLITACSQNLSSCWAAIRGTGHWGRIPTGLAWATIGLVGAAILLQRTAGHPHYAAPIQPLVLLLIIQGLRILRTGRIRGYRFGPDLVSWFTWSVMLFFVLPLGTGTNHPEVRPWSIDRARIQHELEQRPRPQLVIVRYNPKHSMHEEWVYNRADINRAQVVWARDLSPERTQQLIKLFPDREVTILERPAGKP